MTLSTMELKLITLHRRVLRFDQPDSTAWDLLCIMLGKMPPNSQKLSQTVFLRSSYEPECDGSDPGQPCAVLDQGYEGPAAVSRVRDPRKGQQDLRALW